MYGFSKNKKIKCCNIIICVYFNLAKKCVYIFYYYFHFFWVHFTFLCRLILAMGGIVINSCQTVPIVLKSGQRIGLAGISFYYFLWFTKKKIIIYWFFNYIAFENLGARVGAWKIHTELSKILLSLLQGFSSIVAPLWTITWYAYF